MALLERVSTLLRANVNDSSTRPRTRKKRFVSFLDMENQLLQVKTQVAIAIADQHLLEKKKKEHDDAAEKLASKKQSWPYKRARTIWPARP